MNVPHRSSRYLAMYILRYSTVNMFVKAKLTNRITDLCSSCRLQYFALLKDCADLVIACWSSKCLVMSCTNKKQITFPHFPFYCIELKHRIVAHRTPRVQISHLTTANNPTGHLGNAPAHSRGMCASEICAFDMSNWAPAKSHRIYVCRTLSARAARCERFIPGIRVRVTSEFFFFVGCWLVRVCALIVVVTHPLHFHYAISTRHSTLFRIHHQRIDFSPHFVLCQGKCLRRWR